MLIGRLVLAAVFAAAGAAKLADREGSRKAAADFGVPAALAGVVGLALPLAELAVAGALLPASSALWAAAGALGLLLTFSGAISVSIARGRAPDCHCFGQLHSEPAGWRTLGRNGALAAIAGLVLVAGWRDDAGPSAVAWLGRLSPAERASVAAVALAILVAAGAVWLALHLLRAHGRLLVRLERLEASLEHGAHDHAHADDHEHDEPEHGLPVGAPAPHFSLAGTEGRERSLLDLLGLRKTVVLVFTDPDCGPCQALMPEVARWQRDHADEVTVAVVSSGRARDSRAKAEEHGLSLVLADEANEVYELYEGAGTPSSMMILADGTVGSPLVAGTTSIQALVDRARGHSGEDWGIPIGEPVPDLTLRSLDGREVELSAFRGADTLFLFWNPASEFCREMYPDLVAWEADPPAEAPRLVVLASGPVEEVRANGLRSTVLLDTELAATIALRSGGTPSAVLVDAEGRVAWPLAVGSEHVLRLLRSRAPAGVS